MGNEASACDRKGHEFGAFLFAQNQVEDDDPRPTLNKRKHEENEMSMEDFKEQFAEDVKEVLDEKGIDADMTLRTVEKMNESYEAITVTPEGSNVGVNINVDKFYEAVENGADYDSMVQKAADVIDLMV